jgi:hypothetical protein
MPRQNGGLTFIAYLRRSALRLCTLSSPSAVDPKRSPRIALVAASAFPLAYPEFLHRNELAARGGSLHFVPDRPTPRLPQQ